MSGGISDTVDLPDGGSVTYSATCTVDAGASGSIANTATVAAPTGVSDPTPGDDSATDEDLASIPIFTDGSESGDVSAWSSVSPSLDLLTTELERPGAVYWGAFGIARRSLARLRGTERLLVGSDEGGRALFTVAVRRARGSVELRLHARLDDGTWRDSAWTTLGEHARWIEVRWRRALAELEDGELSLHVDGDLRAGLREIPNAASSLSAIGVAKEREGGLLLRRRGESVSAGR